MRIAHFIHRYPPALGGAESYFARLSAFLRDQGDEVHVLTTTAIDLNAFWRSGTHELKAGSTLVDGIHIHRFSPAFRFPGRRYLLKPLSLLPFGNTWRCLLQPSSPLCPTLWHQVGQWVETFDAVHVSALPYAFPLVCGWRLANRQRIPFFITPFLHWGDPTDTHDRTRRAYTASHLRWLLRQADGVFVQTASEREIVASFGIPLGKIHLQGLGVDPGECTGGDRSSARNAWGFTNDEFVIGHLANQSHEKGSTDLLHAFQFLRETSANAKLVLAGPEMPNFRRAWDRLQKEDPTSLRNVVRLGVVSDKQKRDFFAGIDVFALPSRSDSFGLVLLEAWANGIPNVVYRAGGPADLVENGSDGIIVSCGDVQGLASALSQLAMNRESARKFGETGKARVMKGFAWTPKLALVRDTLLRERGH